MGARERTYFELTLKGSEELSVRTYRLDARVRNILFLIQRGFSTTEGILENSIFPRDEVVERLRDLLRGHFIALQALPNGAGASNAAGEADPPPAAESQPESNEPPPVYFGL
jgi:hypothetical protein